MYVKNPKENIKELEKKFTAEIPKYQRDDASCKKRKDGRSYSQAFI